MVADNTIELVPQVRANMVQRRRSSSCEKWFNVLDGVKDPEIPVLSIWELGVLQDVNEENNTVTVTITPTYSGCPAMQHIENQIVASLQDAGAVKVQVKIQLAPAWSSEWMDIDARKRLREYGVAPPGDSTCPQCGSANTTFISEFGSTACKALLRCLNCQEPFDYFKSF